MKGPWSWAVALLAGRAAARLHPAHPDFSDAAAAVMRSHEHQVEQRQSCNGPVSGTPSSWWRAQIGHNGTTPYAPDNTYEYYRTVVQYGADNTGGSDSSDAFNYAINAWGRYGHNVTMMPAYVYVPPGKYLIKKSIFMLVSTFLIGDPLNLPTLVADPALGNASLIYGFDTQQGDGSSTKNFYMALRNLNIDTTRIGLNTAAVAIDWSVSQGCSLTNVHVTMPPSSNHTGMTMLASGSGVIVSDSTFTGGSIGLRLWNQQYLLKGLTFNGCGTGIYIDNSYVTTIQGATFTNCKYGVDLGREGSVGTISIVDSSATGGDAGVLVFVTGNAEGSLVLDNFAVSSAVAVKSTTGSTLLADSVPAGQTWVLGNVDSQGYQSGKLLTIDKPAGLLSNGKYFTMPVPQYENYDISQVISIKEAPGFQVFGDNSHDDGPAINAILQKYAGCKIVFFPQGIYRTNTTIYVPPGSRLIGETLSVISGVGSVFENADQPQPIVQVGKPGEKGVAQLTDLLFSTADILPGAIIVQINMAGDNPGDVGLWNVVVRVGGSVDSRVHSACSQPDPAGCKAAFALLHLSKTSSVYLEDVWGWVADHGLDDITIPQNIAVGRGALIESTLPTWLIGTSFEHCVLYQYNLHNASNVYIALQQTETPYWQGKGTPQRAPAPWTSNAAFGDPTFSNCADQGATGNDQCYRGWAQYSTGSSNILIHGSAFWAFFNKMNDNAWQDSQCNSTGGICQLNMAYISEGTQTFWYSLSSISTANLVYDTTGGVTTTTRKDNAGGWGAEGAVVAAYVRGSSGLPPSGSGSSSSPSPSASDPSKNNANETIMHWRLLALAVGVICLTQSLL